MKPSTSKKPARPRKPRRIPLVAVRVIIEETGERVAAWIPNGAVAKRQMNERGFRSGDEAMAEFKLARNVGFWRLAHALGGWLSDNTERFENTGQHGALKKLQIDSGVGVVDEEFDLGELGKVRRRVAESLAFDCMTEDRFRELWKGWMEWLRANTWASLTRQEQEEIEQMIIGSAQQ